MLAPLGNFVHALILHTPTSLSSQRSGLSRDQHSELVSLLKLLSCLARHLNLNNSSLEDEDDDEGATRRHSQVCTKFCFFFSLIIDG